MKNGDSWPGQHNIARCQDVESKTERYIESKRVRNSLQRGLPIPAFHLLRVILVYIEIMSLCP